MQYLLRRRMMRFRLSAVLVKMGLKETGSVRAESDEKIYFIFTKYSPFRVKFHLRCACIKEVFQGEKLGASFPTKLW